jgi:hypothetical protein
MNTPLMVTAVEGACKAIPWLLSLTASGITTKIFFGIMHLVYLALMAKPAGLRGKDQINTIVVAAFQWLQVRIDVLAIRKLDSGTL